jgi:hypothetical protein
MLKCSCGATMKPGGYGSKSLTYKCRGATEGFGCPASQGSLPQELIDRAILAYLSEHVICPGLTATELEAEHVRAAADARQAKAAAERERKQAETRLESAEEKWLDGKITDKRWGELQEKFTVQRAAAEGEATAADAALRALEQPDPDALAAVERLRADIEAVADDGSAKSYGPLVKRLFDRVELVRGEPPAAPDPALAAFEVAQASEYGDEALISFEHKGRVYGLVPILRSELALIYGADPLVGAADQLRAKASNSASSIKPDGTPNSGNSVSVDKKNVSSTILPSATSSTCNAHGS